MITANLDFPIELLGDGGVVMDGVAGPTRGGGLGNDRLLREFAPCRACSSIRRVDMVGPMPRCSCAAADRASSLTFSSGNAALTSQAFSWFEPVAQLCEGAGPRSMNCSMSAGRWPRRLASHSHRQCVAGTGRARQQLWICPVSSQSHCSFQIQVSLPGAGGRHSARSRRPSDARQADR